MPHQKPLIDLDKLDRNRGEQLKAIDGLAARLQPGIARDGYSVSVQALVSLLRCFDSLTSPQRPCTWHGIAHWSGMTGLSPKQCSRAISVLQSLQLIEARVTWVAFGKRGMKIAINWSTIFDLGPITQDAEDLALWTARKTRQRTLFATRRTPTRTPLVSVSETDTMSTTETDTVSVSERDIVSVSTISNPQIDPLNHSLEEAEGRGPMAEGQRIEWVDGDFESTTEARRHGEGQVGVGGDTHIASAGLQVVCSGPKDQSPVRFRESTDGSNPSLSPSVPSCLRGSNFGPQPSAISHEPSLMPTRPVPPADLIQTLVSLDVANARSAIGNSLQAGYSIDQIRAIVDWYRGEALPDESGKLVFPYAPGQLVLRLRDRDAIAAEPAQGNWQGGKSGFWTRLAPISTPKPRKQPLPAPSGPKPDRIPVQSTYTTAMTASEILTALDHHQAPSPVRQSFHRWAGDKTLPKTLAFWLKANGYRVDESQQGGKAC